MMLSDMRVVAEQAQLTEPQYEMIRQYDMYTRTQEGRQPGAPGRFAAAYNIRDENALYIKGIESVTAEEIDAWTSRIPPGGLGMAHIVHGIQEASLYMHPELLLKIMDVARKVLGPDAKLDAGVDLMMMTHEVIYAMAPNPDALSRATENDVTEVMKLIIKLRADAPPSSS